MGRVRKEEDLPMIWSKWVHYLVDHLPISMEPEDLTIH